MVICCFAVLPPAAFLVVEAAVGLLSSVHSRNISTDWGGEERSQLMDMPIFIPGNNNTLKVCL